MSHTRYYILHITYYKLHRYILQITSLHITYYMLHVTCYIVHVTLLHITYYIVHSTYCTLYIISDSLQGMILFYMLYIYMCMPYAVLCVCIHATASLATEVFPGSHHPAIRHLDLQGCRALSETLLNFSRFGPVLGFGSAIGQSIHSVEFLLSLHTVSHTVTLSNHTVPQVRRVQRQQPASKSKVATCMRSRNSAS